jgi:hypothetical protein
MEQGAVSTFLRESAFAFPLIVVLHMALAGVVASYSGPFRQVRAMQAGDDAPPAAKVMAGFSLPAWLPSWSATGS